jgi:NAD+ diphosphatase
MEMRYCRRCGSQLIKNDSHVFNCQNGHTIYLNPTPGVGVFLFDSEGYLLLSVRGIEPAKGTLDSFGGFIDGQESFEEGLARELREELQIEPDNYSTPEYLTSATSTYEYGGETLIVLSSMFVATLAATAVPVASDDVAAIHRARVEDINLSDIGNADVRKALAVLKQRFAS